jgi:hypothetical protein
MSNDANLHRYSFVVSHPREARLLLLPTDDGWALPSLEYGGDWFAEDVGALGRLVLDRLGADVTVLRHLIDGEHMVGELELHDRRWRPPVHGRWAGRDDLDGLPLAIAAHRTVIERWFAEAASGAVPARRAPWQRRGWFDEAAAWIARQAAAHGITLTGRVQQRKAAWDGSCILHAPSDAGELWFKAVYERPPSEPAVIQLLAERWPASVPAIIAADDARRWMLMRDFGGCSLRGRPAHVWDAAVRLFSRIQFGTTGEVGRWLAIGCPDRRPCRWPAELRAVLADREALLGVERGLDGDDLARLEVLLPDVDALCEELDEMRIPAGMVQQDFRHDNLVVTGDTFCYFDWSDTVVAHPFMSGNRFLDYLSPPDGVDRYDWRLAHPDDDERRRLRDAYLAPWTAFAPMERLRAAFGLARRLNRLFQATRWYAERPYLEPGSVWNAEVMPLPSRFLKRFLMDLTDEL